jgi:nitroreductase
LVASAGSTDWLGTPAPLSRRHREWPVLLEAEVGASKPGGATWAIPDGPPLPEARPPAPPRGQDARQLLLGRRSAVGFDDAFTLRREDFLRILERVLPQSAPPWRVLGAPAHIHLVLFVHRVEGVVPGLYALPRSADAVAPLREATRPEFAWRATHDVAPGLPLFLLAEGDARALAARVSCDQAIAADGAFSLGMVARFDAPLSTLGPWYYRRLLWEAGLVGQVLYLEAEAAGMRGTGIGCFIDSAVHDLLGFENTQFQALYHFTAGRPVEDARLRTRPGYPWE